jgi:UDP-N-acetylglucosamine transferase subunit ALG13
VEKFIGDISKCGVWRLALLIFVTVGSQVYQFNRLLKKIDDLLECNAISNLVFAQTGNSTYSPRNYESKKFLSAEEYNEKVANSHLIITHGGTGAIMSALQAGKQVVAIPRRKKHGEHSDDHQLQIVDYFVTNAYIRRVDDLNDLEVVINYNLTNPINKRLVSDGCIPNIIDNFLLKSIEYRFK